MDVEVKKNKVIYTCLTGNYDNLLDPIVVSSDFDYICFSNDIDQENVGVWKINRIPSSIVDPNVLSRYIKILPHLCLQKYDYSLYIDSNIRIMDKAFYTDINNLIMSDVKVAQVPHIQSDCIYNEIIRCYCSEKISLKEAYHHYFKLARMGYPHHFGLCENNIILRKHNEVLVRQIDERWWNEYLSSPKRDQLTLMVVYWQTNFKPEFIFGNSRNVRNISSLSLLSHLRQKKDIKSFASLYKFVGSCKFKLRYCLMFIIARYIDIISNIKF